jgi:hypothetical protein
MQRVYVVGGLIRDGDDEKGNVFTVPSNRYAEFNMFLDPLAAKTVLESSLNITLIPLTVQRKVASFEGVLGALKQRTQHTPESKLVHRLLLLLQQLLRKQKSYHHMVNDLYCKSELVTLIHSTSLILPQFPKYILILLVFLELLVSSKSNFSNFNYVIEKYIICDIKLDLFKSTMKYVLNPFIWYCRVKYIFL